MQKLKQLHGMRAKGKRRFKLSMPPSGWSSCLVTNATSRYALLAVQGPASETIVQPLTGVDLSSLNYYSFAHGEFANVRGTISRTGYTGEDGFEIVGPAAVIEPIWEQLLSVGKPFDSCSLRFAWLVANLRTNRHKQAAIAIAIGSIMA